MAISCPLVKLTEPDGPAFKIIAPEFSLMVPLERSIVPPLALDSMVPRVEAASRCTKIPLPIPAASSMTYQFESFGAGAERVEELSALAR